jgi:beta-lactamase regulating signal transducer with metallopeptidase domain
MLKFKKKEKELVGRESIRFDDKSFLDVLKNYSLWFLSIMFLEFSFIIIMSIPIELSSIINILLFAIIASSVLSLISNIFKQKVNTIITSIILFIFGVLFSIQCVFFSIFKIYFSLTNLGLGDQVTSYLDKAFSATFSNIFNNFIFHKIFTSLYSIFF